MELRITYLPSIHLVDYGQINQLKSFYKASLRVQFELRKLLKWDFNYRIEVQFYFGGFTVFLDRHQHHKSR